MDSSWLDYVLDSGYVPHAVIRLGIRYQLRDRIRMIQSASLSEAYASKMRYVKSLRTRPIAIETGKANQQHYEVGTGVLEATLGPRMKYSSCYYPKGGETLGQAEVEMLKLYVERGRIKDGMEILDLGCGWGTLCLYLAEVFPNSNITAFSNSTTQKVYIDSVAQRRGFKNLSVITGDIAAPTVESKFPSPNNYDRVVSIELFEHMKNYELLMEKIAAALKPGGLVFIHYFSHRDTPYDFNGGWMTEHFFTGGTMLSSDLLLYFQKDLKAKEVWWVNGRHYAKTCEDWLAQLTANKARAWPHLEQTYGKDKTSMWFYRWQIFYMACAELFAWEGGDTWGVAQYLFEKPIDRVQANEIVQN